MIPELPESGKKNNIFVQSSMISHLWLLSTMIDSRCYDAHWAKEKIKAQSALVIYPMPQRLNEPNLELKI